MKKLSLLLVLLSLLLVGCGQLEGNTLTLKTADPNLSVAFRLLDAPVVPIEETGQVLPDPTPEPPAIVVKGNISSSGEKIYHVPGGAYYDQVKIDESQGERFFESEEEAIAAGWRKAQR